jgi:outer membrane protein assembly factor BamB
VAAVVVLAGCGNREVRLEGERFGTRVPLVASPDGWAAETGPAADVARAINLPAANTFSTWAQRGYDAQNRTPHATLSPNLTQVWSTNIGPGNGRKPSDGRSGRGQRRGLHAGCPRRACAHIGVKRRS